VNRPYVGSLHTENNKFIAPPQKDIWPQHTDWIQNVEKMISRGGNYENATKIKYIHESQHVAEVDVELTGASPLFAKPEMGSVRCRVRKIRRRPWPSAARVRPASVPARTPRGTRTPAMTGRHVTSTPTRGSSHSARRLRSLAFLCSSQSLMMSGRGIYPFKMPIS